MHLITKKKTNLVMCDLGQFNALKLNWLNQQSIDKIMNENVQNCYLQTFILNDLE